MKPYINRDKLNKVVLHAGTNLKLEVDVKGEPPPTIDWSKMGTKIQDDTQIKIENVDYNTTLIIRNPSRKHAGIYTIKAENINGSDEATVEINIIGKFQFIFQIFTHVIRLIIYRILI